MKCQLSFHVSELIFGSHGTFLCHDCSKEESPQKTEKKRFSVIVNVNLEYEFDVEFEELARLKAEAVILPYNTVDDSFEILEINELQKEEE